MREGHPVFVGLEGKRREATGNLELDSGGTGVLRVLEFYPQLVAVPLLLASVDHDEIEIIALQRERCRASLDGDFGNVARKVNVLRRVGGRQNGLGTLVSEDRGFREIGDG